MEAGTFLLIAADVIAQLKADGYIKSDGSFDDGLFNNIAADLKLASEIEAILKKYGVAVPPKVDQVFKVIPLLGGFLK